MRIYWFISLLLVSACSSESQDQELPKKEIRDKDKDLASLAADFSEKILSPHENIHVAVGYGLANSILVIGDEKDMIIDTMGGVETAEVVLEDLSKYSDNEIDTIVYTHFHIDHVGGAQAFINKFGEVDVISHRDTSSEVEKFFGIKRELIGQRSQKMFGLILKDRDQALSHGIGIKLEAGVDTPGYIKPTITFDQKFTKTIGGRKVDFYHAPGETDDQIFVWIEEMKALFPGDNIYKAFPNIYTIRGTSYRSFQSWYKSLEKMMSLEPEILVPSHGVPIVGKEEIQKVLSNYRDAVKYVHDQTHSLLNAGYTPVEAAQLVKLPDSLRNNEYLFELYGNVEWSARNLFNGNYGWFDGNPTNLFPFTEKELGKRIGSLISENTLQEELESSIVNKDYQWTLYLADMLEAKNGESIDVNNAKAVALKALGEDAYNPNAKSFYLSTYADLKDETDKKREALLTTEESTGEDVLRQLSLNMFYEVMSTRLNPENVSNTSIQKKIYFRDLNEIWELSIHNSVFTYKEVSSEMHDIEMDSLTFKLLVTGNLNAITDILVSNKLAQGDDKRGFLNFLAFFTE